jgi:hypothetical protein
MRRQLKAAKPLAPEAGHTCGECGQGTFDMKVENLSLEGKPTLVSCPFQPFKMVVSERACSHFTQREQNTL